MRMMMMVVVVSYTSFSYNRDNKNTRPGACFGTRFGGHHFLLSTSTNIKRAVS